MNPSIIGVIGNPNCGKTTLFNALTGARQHVGNWPGVTVERKEGSLHYKGSHFKIIDLPGTYSLDSDSTEVSLDEKIARDFVLADEADIIINILDASNLHRNLFLTSQLLDMKVPLICVVNMIDVAKKDGIQINFEQLSEQLGVPVIPMVASEGKGTEVLCQAIQEQLQRGNNSTTPLPLPTDLKNAIAKLTQQLGDSPDTYWQACRLLESSDIPATTSQAVESLAVELRTELENKEGQSIDTIIANGRYQAIEKLLENLISTQEQSISLTEKIDAWVLNRWLGIPIFFFIMYLMFVFAINVGGAFIDFFDIAFGTIFVDGFKAVLNSIGSPEWLTTLVADGLGGGIQLVATFIPIIAGLYLFLSVIEDSGYMARAAFVMDRLMRTVGLPGKAFVPLIVGFGCNVPAVMAARTMDNEKDRLLTIAMAPFMSCGARLSVYALFAAAFFTENGALAVFSLYLLGILMAILTGLSLKTTLFRMELTPFVMELPSYHIPTLKGVLIKTWSRLKSFVLRAGKTIIIVVIILSFLNSFGTDGSFGNENDEKSVLSKIAKTATPVLSPLGVDEENWPATVGIITGIFAKEAVVGTLDALYSQQEEADDSFNLVSGLKDAVMTIPENLSGIANSFLDPLGLSIIGADQGEEQGVRNSTFTSMATLFGSSWAAFSYLVLILLYTPCVATLGAMVRESGIKWMLFVAGWSTGLAYTTAVIVYQLGNLSSQPYQALAWIGSCLTLIATCLICMRTYGKKQDAKKIPIIQVH